MHSDPLYALPALNDDFQSALAEVFDGMARLTQLRADHRSAPDLSPMVPSEIDEIRFGNSSANSMTITSAEAGLVGMGGNDTLTGGAADELLVGDYFDVDLFNGADDLTKPFDPSVVGNDVIYGGIGADYIWAGLGNDSGYGGDGDDNFIVSESQPGIDYFFGGAGDDSIQFADVWNLGYTTISVNQISLGAAASIETLIFVENIFNIAIDVSGTSSGDTFDLAGVSVYADYDGFDTVQGTGDFDLLAGNDRFTGGVSQELVDGGDGNDTITGNGGNDTLVGGRGADSMIGGKGNDLYFVDARLDAIKELSGQGTDTVKTTLSGFDLADNVENLTNIGSAGFKGTGNTLKNTISGNNFNDTLNGGLGNDTLSGFGGNDAFVFNTALGSSNVDTITDFKPGFDLIHLENTGTGLFNKIRAGELTEAAFKITTPQSAVDADDRIIYNAATGRLIYDADGSGSGVGITFAFLTPNLALTAGDFLVI